MEIIAIVGLVIMGFILGFACRRTEPSCALHWDYDIKCGKLASLETKVFMLERENERFNYLINKKTLHKKFFEECYYAHCRNCEKTFYSRDFKDKDVADLLNKITLSSEEIAKKLGFDMK